MLPLLAACALLTATTPAVEFALDDGLLAISDEARVAVWAVGADAPRYVLESPAGLQALALRGERLLVVDGTGGFALAEGPHLTFVATPKEPPSGDLGLDPAFLGMEAGGVGRRVRLEATGLRALEGEICLPLDATRRACQETARNELRVVLCDDGGACALVRGNALLAAGPAGIAVRLDTRLLLLDPEGAVLAERGLPRVAAVGPAGFAFQVSGSPEVEVLDAAGRTVAHIPTTRLSTTPPPPVPAPAWALGLQTTEVFRTLDPGTGAILWTCAARLALNPRSAWSIHPWGLGEAAPADPAWKIGKTGDGVEASRGHEVLWTHPAREFIHDGDEVVALRPDMTHWIGVDKQTGAQRWAHTLEGRWTYDTWQGDLLFFTEHIPDRGVRFRALGIDTGRVVAEGVGGPGARLLDLPDGLMILSDRGQPMTVTTLKGETLAAVPQGKVVGLLDGDALVLAWEGEAAGLAVVDPQRGLRWRQDLPLKTTEVQGAGDLVVVFHDGELTAYDADSGAERWRRPWSERLWGAHALR